MTVDLDISGAWTVTLLVHSKGDAANAHCVWLEPIIQAHLDKIVEASESDVAERSRYETDVARMEPPVRPKKTLPPASESDEEAEEEDARPDAVEEGEGEIVQSFMTSFNRAVPALALGNVARKVSTDEDVPPPTARGRARDNFMMSFGRGRKPPLAAPSTPASAAAPEARDSPLKAELLQSISKIRDGKMDTAEQVDVVADLSKSLARVTSLPAADDGIHDAETSSLYIASTMAKENKGIPARKVSVDDDGKWGKGDAASELPSKPVITHISDDQLQDVGSVDENAGEALKDLLASDWEVSFHAITALRSMVKFHPDDAAAHIVAMVPQVLVQAANLRSSISRNAITLLQSLLVNYSSLEELDVPAITACLLARTTASNNFIKKETNAALASLTAESRDTRPVPALLEGTGHKNPTIQAHAGLYLQKWVEAAAETVQLRTMSDTAGDILLAFAKMVTARNPIGRDGARKGLRLLHAHLGDASEGVQKKVLSEVLKRDASKYLA